MIDARFKNFFFDKAAVVRKTTDATRRVLSKFGAYVRTRAKSSIRRRKGASKPGSPPSSHTDILKRFIYFGYDPDARSVVIGPQNTNQIFFGGDGRPVRGTVPEVLEKGGQITILEVFKYGRWQRANLRSRRRLAGLPMRKRTISIQARPYMAPAAEKELPGLPGMWADSIK